MPTTNTVTNIRAGGMAFAVQFSASRSVVAVSRAALLDHLGNEVADLWRQLSADMRRAIRVAVHQQLRGA